MQESARDGQRFAVSLDALGPASFMLGVSLLVMFLLVYGGPDDGPRMFRSTIGRVVLWCSSGATVIAALRLGGAAVLRLPGVTIDATGVRVRTEYRMRQVSWENLAAVADIDHYALLDSFQLRTHTGRPVRVSSWQIGPPLAEVRAAILRTWEEVQRQGPATS